MTDNPLKNSAYFDDPEMTSLIYAALDASSTGIIITDNRLPDNPIIYHNKAFETITGYNTTEIIGHNCRFLQGRDRSQEAREQIRQALQDGEDIRIEIRNYTKKNDLFWNELYISPITNAKGEVTHFIGVQNNITARKKVEEQLVVEKESIERKVAERTENLRMSEEYLNSIVETIRESLVVLDPNLNVLTVNEAFLRTFKVTRSETIGLRLYDLGNRQWDIAKLKNLLEEVLPSSNPVLGFEVEHKFPHIGHKIMMLNAHRVELQGKFKDRILLAIEDVTDRRAIEKRKDDFLSIASHELKTPLTAVKGYMQLIKRFMPENNPKLTDIIEKSDNQIERLQKLIAELLDVSKIQSGKLDIHHDTFDFDKMVRDTIENIQLNSDSHKVVLRGETNAQYDGDETHISQVVGNLISNAIKYSPGKDRVEVYLSTLKNHIKFSVKDFGFGINMEDQKKVFDRFYRVDSIQKKFAGLGVGLYISEQIITQHGGTIWVDSDAGEGATFSFILPHTEK
ncbi:PAS domain-containing sensor histidine kinase [Sphingobacterium paludis]|uniref:histidine kinase n=1 Tax=Sphingobacterium paludis TaxID=1476465 RepID=A0A4R7CXD6_9SPHI|nr:ATP-binding protein [Sphingobacterium paludis]TDS11764.1 PAS domain S-box-containing protein [Sphingobacterium paludis]